MLYKKSLIFFVQLSLKNTFLIDVKTIKRWCLQSGVLKMFLIVKSILKGFLSN